MLKYFVIFLLLLSVLNVNAQLSGTKSIPGDYATISAAVTAINSAGVGAGGVIFNIDANYTETISAPISLTATGTLANAITFRKNPLTVGANPLITAYTGGTATQNSATQDGIWNLRGSDYVTIDGVDLTENPLNIASPETMEYGYALYKASTTNGCQYVTIQNCTITLTRQNNDVENDPMVDGSVAILLANSTVSTATSVMAPISVAGTNSYNNFYSNVIENCNVGIAMIGYAAASPYTNVDRDNDIGGIDSSTGNIIKNFGGATSATRPAAGIRTLAQYGLNIGYNTINNNDGGGVNHANTLYGIQLGTAAGTVTSVHNNTITVHGAGTTHTVYGISNGAGSTPNSNTVDISNNIIENSTYTTATTGSFYGIYNSATPTTLNIEDNTIRNNLYQSSSSGAVYLIYNNGAATNSYVNNNTLSNNRKNGGSGSFIGIYNTAVSSNVEINTNTIENSIINSTSGSYYAIYNYAAIPIVNEMKNNKFGTASSYAAVFEMVNTSTHYMLYNRSGSASSTIDISNNDFRSISCEVLGALPITFLRNSGSAQSQIIDGNTFTNFEINSTGALTLISNSTSVASGASQSVSNNAIVGSFTRSTTATSGALTLHTSSTSSTDGANIVNEGNNFSNITVYGAATIAGWVNTDAGAGTKAIRNNIFDNWIGGTGAITALNVNVTSVNNLTSQNTISNLQSAGSITGLATAAGNDKITENEIYNISSTGVAATVTGISITGGTLKQVYNNIVRNLYTPNATTATIRGISVSGGTTINVFGNKIYALSNNSSATTTGVVYGILASGSTTAAVITNIYNNLIGDLTAPQSNSVDAIRGIATTASRANSNINLYHNTIYLNASSTGTNFGCTGIYQTTRTTVTTAALDMRNNIIVNASTARGTGLIVAFRRSAADMSNYLPTSNNNLFYAGTAGAANRIHYSSTTVSDITLNLFKTRVAPAEQNSVAENLVPKFLSTNGADPSYLRLDPLQSTQAESGAGVVEDFEITTDIDAQTRHGIIGYVGTGSAPDIGADEFEGVRLNPFSGAINVGTGQTYTSLTGSTGLFQAINLLGLSDNLEVNIVSDLTEDGTYDLYAYEESGVGNYTITIQSDGSAHRLISGNVLSGLIRLSGVKRVVFDGKEGNYLTFRNTNTAGTTGSAFRLIDGASNITLKNCNLEAYANATTGVLLFSTSTASVGNSNNLIQGCNIRGTVGVNTSPVGIYSKGTIAQPNINNSIINNNIFDFYEIGIDITSTGSNSFTISGNSIYNGTVTATKNYSVNPTLISGIRILGGYNYIIEDNFIGGSEPLAQGASALYYSSTGRVYFQGIQLTSTTPFTTSVIKGNTITNLTISTVPTSANAPVFYGIITAGSNITIGGTQSGDGNTIGSNIANGAIAITTYTTSRATYVRGINCNSAGGSIIGNQISGIDIQNIASSGVGASTTFLGIYTDQTVAPTQINNNIIGSTGAGAVAHSIRVVGTSTATATSITAISIASATNTMEIRGNTIQNLSNLSTVNLTGILRGILTNSGSATADFSIVENQISDFYLAAFGSGGTSTYFNAIQNAGASNNIRITDNTIYGFTTPSVGGNVFVIFNSGAVRTSLIIDDNVLGTNSQPLLTFSGNNTVSHYAIYSTAGAATCDLSISTNRIRNINFASAAALSPFLFIQNSAATLSQTINENQFIDLNIQSAGSVTFITNSVVVSAAGTQNINSNAIVTGFTKKAGGTITGITSSASAVSGAIINIKNNDFSEITTSGATIINGLVNTDAGTSTKTIEGNVFRNWIGGSSAITVMSVNITATTNSVSSNIIDNISGSGVITGIATAAGNDNIYLNTIANLTSTGVGPVNAILVSGGTTKNIYKNRIYNITANNSSGVANGITISAGLSVTVFNNLIGNIYAPISNLANGAIGINITSTTATSAINLYYNTIYLNALSTGTNFGTSAIYHAASATSTTATLTMINNIFANFSTPNGTGITVAYRRSATNLDNYAVASNNNLFYAGTPGVSRLIFYDGSNSDQTLAAFMSRVSTRESNAVTEDISSVLLSTDGSSNVFLHLDPLVPTLIESGGINISGITQDFDEQIRQGNPGYPGAGTAPDIGADEISGIELVPPTIDYTQLSDATNTTNRTLSNVDITDDSGVNVTAGTKPRLYYKRLIDANTYVDNSSATNGWKYVEASNGASPFEFTINYALLFGGTTATVGTIQYFVVAQDKATIPNVGINSGLFNANPESVALLPAAFPITGTINSYKIPFSGNYSVGNDQVFRSLTKTDGLFNEINNIGLMGNTTINVTTDLTEDGAVALNQWVESGAGNYTLTIKAKDAAERLISGDALNGLITLSGADRVTFNGQISSAGSFLTVRNTNTLGTTASAFKFIEGASNNILQSLKIEAYTNNSNGAIHFSTSTIAGGNSNNTINLCNISSTVLGNNGHTAIYSEGTVGNDNVSNAITTNTIRNFTNSAIKINSTGSSQWTITGNSIFNGAVSSAIDYPADSQIDLISILGGSGYTITNNYLGSDAATLSGASAIYGSTLGNIEFTAINLTTSAATPTSVIKTNSIGKITLNSIPTAPNSPLFTGIRTLGEGISVGGLGVGDGNLIGSNSTNGSITLNTLTTDVNFNSKIFGIDAQQTGGVIDGNQVGGFDIANNGVAPASSLFCGINISNATAPTSIRNNIVGSNGAGAVSHSIRFRATSESLTPEIYGIEIGSAVNSSLTIESNIIQNISNRSTLSSGSFVGIRNVATLADAILTINLNTIKNIGSVANSNANSSSYKAIYCLSPSTISNNTIHTITHLASSANAQIIGIYTAGNFNFNISSNTLTSLSSASQREMNIAVDPLTNSAIVGILNHATGTSQLIESNNISSFSLTNTGNYNNAIVSIGISNASNGNIYKNRIYALSNVSTGSAPFICGVLANNGEYNVYNNVVRLNNLTNFNGVGLYGLVHNTATTNWNYFHNTVRVWGNSTGTALKTASFIRLAESPLYLRNNLFTNSRSGTGTHYAISNATVTPGTNWTGTTSDFSNYYTTAATPTEWGSGNPLSFDNWKTASSADTNSKNRSVSYITSTADLEPNAQTNCWLNNSATPITLPLVINTDINNLARSGTTPDIGAYEFAYTQFSVTASNNSPSCAAEIDFTSDAPDAINPTYTWRNPLNESVATSNEFSYQQMAGVFTVLVADVNGCESSTTTTLSTNATFGNWIGTNSSDWSDPENWCGGVPVANANVVIPNTVNDPIVDVSVELNNITIQSNAALTIDGGSMGVAGTITNNAVFDSQNGTIELKGTAIQTISNNLFTGNNVKKLHVNNSNGINITAGFAVTEELLLSSGTLTTNNNLTLTSTTDATAFVSETGTANVVGNITMQRYLPTAFGYKYFSSPFTAATVNEFADDLDLSATFPSFYRYNENTALPGWVDYTNSANPLLPMVGYAANFGNLLDPKTVDLTGEISSGNMSIDLYNHNYEYTKGFNLVGNPYPSPIDWDAPSGWTKTNIDNAIYFYSASDTSQYDGIYVSYVNGISSDGITNSIIPAMQGFFVHVSDGAYPVVGTLGFSNSVRINNVNPIFKNSKISPETVIRINAKYAEEPLLSDAMVVYLTSNVTPNFDKKHDAKKIMNSSKRVPSIYSITPDNQKLSINALPIIENQEQIVPIGINANADGNILISLNQFISPSYSYVYLVDKKYKKSYSLNVTNELEIFTQKGIDSNRFLLVLTNNPSWKYAEQKNLTFAIHTETNLLTISALDVKVDNCKLQIFNLAGQLMFSQCINLQMPVTINTNLKQGIYVVALTHNNTRYTKKIIVVQ